MIFEEMFFFFKTTPNHIINNLFMNMYVGSPWIVDVIPLNLHNPHTRRYSIFNAYK